VNLVSDLLRVGLVDPCGGGQLGRRVRDVAFRLPRGLRSPSGSERVVYAGYAGWVPPDRNVGLLRMRRRGRSATIWWRVACRVV
jgi:hypothetical protein